MVKDLRDVLAISNCFHSSLFLKVSLPHCLRTLRLETNTTPRFNAHATPTKAEVGDSNTAHETGIFYFTSVDSNGKVLSKGGVHFENLFVKRNGKWETLMEYQKSKATQEEWDALK